MLILGIFINDSNENITKILKKSWYPFGNFDNCHDYFFENKKNHISSQINYTKKINKELYNKNESDSVPNICINAIVGKNGSGKSSLIALQFRIINNLARRLVQLFPENGDYHTIWASGFNAELYFELNDKIYCVQITKNIDFTFADNNNINDKVFLYDEKKINLLDLSENKDSDKEKSLKKIKQSLFYTIGSNYGLYSNLIVRDEWNKKKETWLQKIYHKNDGYFTPIVLVPYKQNSSTIDIEKEYLLAQERVSTLSILLYNKDIENSFIKDYTPFIIKYQLKSEEEYEDEIKGKYVKLLNPEEYEEERINDLYISVNKIYKLNEVKKIVEDIWLDLLFNKENEKKFKNQIKLAEKEQIYETIKKNIINYLTFKLIKICKQYDEYKQEFLEKNLFICFDKTPNTFKSIITKLIKDMLDLHGRIDFINLKIKQCVYFLFNNLSFYLREDRLSNKTIQIDDIKELCKNDLTYDDVFKNLLPPIFLKEFYYKKNNKELRPLSSLSSGEDQLLFSLSYVIYHIKNALSNKKSIARIPYTNFNLVFDEAELYYHPEYQRTFIKDLIEIIYRSNLVSDNNEKVNINITIITHSPFILSDIPANNIMFLNEGNCEKRIETDSFAANIYDLLKNQFFMNAPIGDVAINTIDRFIDISKKEIIVPKKEIDNYLEIAKLIGDPYIKDSVIYKLEMKKKKDLLMKGKNDKGL